MRYCPTDVTWADVLTKPLQGQKFRDMCAFLQNCSRSYDDDTELQTDKLARKSLKPQVKTVASSRECVGERTKSTREKKGKRRGETRARAVSRGEVRHKLFLMKRQDRDLLRDMQRRHLKVS